VGLRRERSQEEENGKTKCSRGDKTGMREESDKKRCLVIGDIKVEKKKKENWGWKSRARGGERDWGWGGVSGGEPEYSSWEKRGLDNR